MKHHEEMLRDDQFYARLFGLNNEEITEYRRMIEPDETLLGLVQEQTLRWRNCLEKNESRCMYRRRLLIAYLSEFASTVHEQGGFGLNLVLSLGFFLVDKVELSVEDCESAFPVEPYGG